MAVALITGGGGEGCGCAIARRFAREDAFVLVCDIDAAIGAFHPEAPLDYWDEIVAIDFLGTVWATRMGIDALRESGGGAIVNVSSTSALQHQRSGGSPIYDVAKMAILRLSTRLAFLRAQNIRVNCIVPHWIATPMLVEYVSQLTTEERTRAGVPDRLIPVDEVADVVCRFLRSTFFARHSRHHT
ncbi:MAG: SDR family NAD(P)-dependent oxidoreductase [Vulcanimicrobiaceae bacterium]